MTTARPEPDSPAAEARARIAAAARDLFTLHGYERTTVDAIAERAGVGRRTFFRYFRSKDDAIFPDHDRIALVVGAHLRALDDVSPMRAVCSGARVVFRSYVDDATVAVERYRLTRSVPALRDRETASVSQYTRLFGRYLADRLGDAPGAPLRAGVMAAAVVAAHNQVLREWLRGGGEGDPMPALDAAFGWVGATFEPAAGRPVPVPSSGAQGPAQGSGQPADGSGHGGGLGGGDAPGVGQGTGADGQDGEDVVVAVFRTGDSLDDVMERISRQL